MADSVRVLQQDAVPRIHGTKSTGKLYKGHGVVAANTSIPTKYQTIVIDNADKRGFASTAKRFNYDKPMTENPGPAAYLGTIDTNLRTRSTSHSKRGTGTFASKSKRGVKFTVNSAPPSSKYALPSMLQSKVDFRSTNTTSSFALPMAQPSRRPDETDVPAPNSYNPLNAPPKRANNVAADSAFKSKSKRELIKMDEAKKKPGPGQYTVKEDLTRDRVKVPYSSFKSTSHRKIHSFTSKVPGPGTYHPGEPVDKVKKQELPKKHYLCISAPAMPLPDTPPAPGPGQYELRDFEGPAKHYMSSSMFVSGASRWQGDALAVADLPGPAHYKPGESGKQSFIYNAAGRWLPM